MSWFLFTDALSHEALCRYILTPISIFPLENHPSPLLSIATESPPLDKSLSAVGVNVLERQMKSTSISCQCSVPTQCIQGTDRVTKKQLKLSYFQRYRSSDFHEWGRVLNYFAYLLRLLELPFLLCQIMNFKSSWTLIMGLTDCRLLVHFDVSHDYWPNKIYQWMKNDTQRRRENLDNNYVFENSGHLWVLGARLGYTSSHT